MTNRPRTVCPPKRPLDSISATELAYVSTAGSLDHKYWSTKAEPDRDILKRFKHEQKDHYFWGQRGRCCYCSTKLQENQMTFDLEHVIDKRSRPDFMFDLLNFGIACKPCNNAKHAKNVLAGAVSHNIPTNSQDYLIVHPQLDNWEDHLEWDDLDRIRPLQNSPKGKATISLCGIASINAARLADEFSASGRHAEPALRGFYKVKKLSTKKKYVSLLRDLAQQVRLASALAIVDRLEAEVAQEEADMQSPVVNQLPNVQPTSPASITLHVTTGPMA